MPINGNEIKQMLTIRRPFEGQIKASRAIPSNISRKMVIALSGYLMALNVKFGIF